MATNESDSIDQSQFSKENKNCVWNRNHYQGDSSTRLRHVCAVCRNFVGDFVGEHPVSQFVNMEIEMRWELSEYQILPSRMLYTKKYLDGEKQSMSGRTLLQCMNITLWVQKNLKVSFISRIEILLKSAKSE